MAPRSPSARLATISNHLEDREMSATTQIPDQLPWNPNCTKFPSLKNLPRLPNAPEGAAWVWGKDDQVWSICGLILLPPRSILIARIAGETEPVDAAACQGVSGRDPNR